MCTSYKNMNTLLWAANSLWTAECHRHHGVPLFAAFLVHHTCMLPNVVGRTAMELANER